MKKHVQMPLIFFFFLLPACSSILYTDKSYIPTEEYTTVILEGFKVNISPEALAYKQKILEKLSEEFRFIRSNIPKERLALISSTLIWVELNAKEKGFAEYHPSLRWLKENGYNPDKHKGIEVSNVGNYLTWSSNNITPHPMVHELAHVLYHVLSAKEKIVINKAYTLSLASERYQSVYRLSKKIYEDGWALEDEWEYFSELSVAYFSINDYFPHTRKQLRKYDNDGYKMVESIWLTDEPKR